MKHQVVIVIAASCLTPAIAHAYVDPGSGMLIWQGLVALIGAILMFARNPWQTIKRFFARLRKK